MIQMVSAFLVALGALLFAGELGRLCVDEPLLDGLEPG